MWCFICARAYVSSHLHLQMQVSLASESGFKPEQTIASEEEGKTFLRAYIEVALDLSMGDSSEDEENDTHEVCVPAPRQMQHFIACHGTRCSFHTHSHAHTRTHTHTHSCTHTHLHTRPVLEATRPQHGCDHCFTCYLACADALANRDTGCGSTISSG